MNWTRLSTLTLGLLVAFTFAQAQSVWEKTFFKTDHSYQDYSVTTAQDGSEDIVLAGTLINTATGQHQINVVRIEDQSGTVLFDENYHPGFQAWGMSIASYAVSTGTGYAVTGFADVNGVRRTLVMTIDETGSQIDSKLYEQESPATSGMGLNIKATPNAADAGFVLVGMTHEDLAGSTLRFAEKKAFCMKVDQNLNLTWEKYFDTPLGSAYNIDYDGASFVMPTDQGYFITGGKNGLTAFGQQRQAMLAVMLDPGGSLLWDNSSYTGNAIDNGASAYYDQPSQKVYLLTNISVTHHLGLMVYDANTGAVDYTQSLEAYTSNGELDKYGYALVKAPFQDKLLIQGRGRDLGWISNPPTRGQPAFIVDYDLGTQQFGVQYQEGSTSEVLNSIAVQDPFWIGGLRTYYYPQSMTNINGSASAFLSYDGDTGDDASLIVRKFRHLNANQYEFCEEGVPFLLDTFRVVNDLPGEPIGEPVFNAVLTDVTLIGTDEVTSIEDNCIRPGEEPFCEGNLVQNGDFETGTPTNGDEDIANASNWGGIWSNSPPFSSADFYNTTGTTIPGSLNSPLPATQSNYAGFWCRNQGGDVYREGIMNTLSAPVTQNSGVYELTLKVACMFDPFNSPSLSIYGTNGATATGGPLVDAATPINTGLFSDVYTIGTYPIPNSCDNNFTTITFIFDTQSAVGFPAAGFDHIYLTRADGTDAGAYLAIDDVCLRWIRNSPFLCENNLVQNGDFETGTATNGDEDITNATNWGGIWSNTPPFSSADLYNTTGTTIPGVLNSPLPASQSNYAGFWCRNQGGNVYREGVMNQLSAPIAQNSGVYELTLKVACMFDPFNSPALGIYGTDGALATGGPLVDATTPVNTALFGTVYTIGTYAIPDSCDNNFTTITFTFDSQASTGFPATGIDHIFLTRAGASGSGAYLAVDDVCLRWVRESTFLCEGNLVQNGDFETGTPTASDEDITNATNWGGIWSNAGTGFSSADFYSDLVLPPASLTPPLPASQGQYAGFWSRVQGGNVYREGVLNELGGTILPNTGIYELTFKTACLFTPSTPASMSIFVANGTINGGAALTSGTTPANTALFSDSWEFAVHPISTNCDNNFQTVTYLLNTHDPSFPSSGVDALFFTRTDGIDPGAYVAIDDVCLKFSMDVGTNDVMQEHEFPVKVYPNPVSDQLRIEWTAYDAGEVQLQLFDSSGRLIRSQVVSQNETVMQFATLPAGLYMLRINTADGRQITRRVVKQ